jgi:hypothetical protein
MAKSSAIEKSELNKIIGESYFNEAIWQSNSLYHNTKEKKEDGIMILSIRLCSLQAKDFESASPLNSIKLLMAKTS